MQNQYSSDRIVHLDGQNHKLEEYDYGEYKMAKIELSLPDGSKKEYESGVTGQEIALGIGERLARDAIAIRLDDEIIDLTRPITRSSRFQILTFKDEEGREVFRHSASHVLAIAAKRAFPGIKLTIGPAIDDGFYYDFDVSKPFTPKDLEKLEDEMKKVISEDIVFERIDVDSKEAKEKQKHEPYKLEMIDELGDEQITLYKNKEFIDLCKGPHVPSTGKIKAFKLTKIAGAYWRGDAKNKQLQRVYGVAFPDKKELKQYLHILEEAEKRNHRKIGKDLDLFSIHEEGPGFPFFHPKGMVIINELIDFWKKEHKKAGYVEVKTPIILNRSLWEQSGHWDHYKDNMYFTKIDNMDFAVKPMNCPGGILIYKHKIHSYKELPIRMGELGQVHRHELSGVLNGLFRVRTFTQDDAHIFMTEEQIKEEIIGVIDLIDKIYKVFGYEYHVELSTKPEKAIDSDKWETAEKGLEDALKAKKMDYKVNPGDGAFYGPKIDFHIKDSLGRTWQCATIQLDFAMPEKFDLTYEGKDGRKHRPVMIHRVVFGSIERFLGIMIEHYGGRFPLWISPIQARVIGITDNHSEYVNMVSAKMNDLDIRADSDNRTETVNYKVRDAQLQQINYILVAGDKEIENNTVNVRTRDGKILGEMKVDDVISKIKEETMQKI